MFHADPLAAASPRPESRPPSAPARTDHPEHGKPPAFPPSYPLENRTRQAPQLNSYTPVLKIRQDQCSQGAGLTGDIHMRVR